MNAANDETSWAVLAQWGVEPRMTDFEALMWRGERHPEYSSTGVVMELMSSVPDWERFRAAHVWGTSMVRRLRQRVVEPVLPLGPPAWVDDTDFDIDRHLRRVRLPEPAGMRELLELAQDIGAKPLDRSRPLWHGTLVENLEGGRSAYLIQIHHCLMDGAAAVQLFGGLHSGRAEPTPNKPVPVATEPDHATPLTLTTTDLLRQLRGLPSVPKRGIEALGAAFSDPARSLRYVASLRRVVSAAATADGSPLQRRQTGRGWRFGMLDCGLAQLKAAGRTAGGSVNDAYVAALLGGIRRYHDEIGIALAEVPMVIPVSVRRPEDPPGGNRFAAAFFAGQAEIRDPVELIVAIRDRVRAVRAEPALQVFEMMSPGLSKVPRSMLSRIVDSALPHPMLSASNFPGLAHEVYAAGARVEGMYVFAPLPGVSMLAALGTYAGTCCIGINCDAAVFEDTELLWRCMAEGLEEVLEIGRVPPHHCAGKGEVRDGGA